MRDEKLTTGYNNYRRSRGIVLLVTLVLLVVLASISYTLSIRVADRRHRDNYIINYQAARYACDSATKFAITVFDSVDVNLVSRPNEPDFSSLFALSEEEYNEYLDQWALEEENKEKRDFKSTYSGIDESIEINSIAGMNDFTNMLSGGIDGFGEPNALIVRGPYGPQWPLITEPLEFEIGTAKVTIRIEDENAKYPIYWAVMKDKKIQRQAQAGFEIFCEWMDVNDNEIDLLLEQLEQVSEIKPFKLELKPIKVTTTKRSTSTRRSRRRGRRRGRTKSPVRQTKTIPVSVQISDFAKLLHSSQIDIDILARPTIESESRNESALKYMGMWASRKVNINTAPKHVLEAAFVFGGDEVEIAEEIIEQRRIKPFKDTEDLRRRLFGYSDSIKKCEQFIIMTSDFFTIRITATNGTARASTIMAVTRTITGKKKKTERVAVISG